MRTSELTGTALDWAVAKCEGEDYCDHDGVDGIGNAFEATRYSTNWAQGGPIIEREGITLNRTDQKSFAWQQPWVSYRIEHLFMDEYEHEYQYGPTPLIAAMRCYVASMLGDNIEIPEELTRE